MFCVSSNPARGVSEIHDGEDLRQWPQLVNQKNNSSSSFTLPSQTKMKYSKKYCKKQLYQVIIRNAIIKKVYIINYNEYEVEN